jgi:hypothetical protein
MADQEVSPAPVDNTTPNTEEVTAAAPEQPVEGQTAEQVTPASAAV